MAGAGALCWVVLQQRDSAGLHPRTAFCRKRSLSFLPRLPAVTVPPPTAGRKAAQRFQSQLPIRPSSRLGMESAREMIPAPLLFSGSLLQSGASGKECECQCKSHKRLGFDPWVGKIPGEGHGNPLQYSCLENPMDGEAWWATVHGIAESAMTEAT